MPYRLRLRLVFDDRLLVTTDHETAAEAGRQLASFPMDGLGDNAAVRYEVAYVDGTGRERPGTQDEIDEVSSAYAARLGLR